jgi:hypothetical protein
MIAGTIATDLVTKDLIHLLIFKFKNPSITNYPAIVPDKVALWPEANNPIAQIYFPDDPNVLSKVYPAVCKLIPSLKSSEKLLKCAKVPKLIFLNIKCF